MNSRGSITTPKTTNSGTMYHKRTQRLVEICPQCCRGVDCSTARLVSDACGHKKCRVCLLQEINGCSKCGTEAEKNTIAQPRKSVITCKEEMEADASDGSTCHIIHQAMQKDILFPPEIVKRSSTNFFHLKRTISERFFKESNRKADKNCGTEEDLGQPLIPKHIKYFCTLHNTPLDTKEGYYEHSLCVREATPKCKFCDKIFPSYPKLHRHLRIHTTVSNFQCKECEKHFKDNYALRTHMRIHTGEKAFQCPHCSLKLSQLWSLKRHLAKHDNNRKFICNLCGFKFLTKSELTRHEELHTRSKVFLCRTCNVKFSSQKALSRHARNHNDRIVPLVCNLCEASFKRKDNLRRHLRNTHST